MGDSRGLPGESLVKWRVVWGDAKRVLSTKLYYFLMKPDVELSHDLFQKFDVLRDTTNDFDILVCTLQKGYPPTSSQQNLINFVVHPMARKRNCISMGI